MKPCLLALDLDGTACNDQSRLGEKTKQALLAARSRGHVVVFASGRRDIDMVSMGDSHRCADYLVLNNGGKLIRTSDGAVLFNELIDAGAACSLITHCLEHNYLLHVVSGMYWAVNRWDEGLQKYVDPAAREPSLYFHRCVRLLLFPLPRWHLPRSAPFSLPEPRLLQPG